MILPVLPIANAVRVAAAHHAQELLALFSACSFELSERRDLNGLAGQSAADQDWDIKDCQAEAGYRTGYSPTDSPLANVMQRLFFFGTAGASLGGLVTGFPATVESQATEGLIAGAGAGGE